VQLQNARQRFEAREIKLAAISYDSPAILKEFADRRKIDYPLLADPESKIIAAFGVLNPEATGMQKGMALPGYFYVDANGIIREKYFEAKYTDRFTANNVMVKVFPELAEEVSQKVSAPILDSRPASQIAPLFRAAVLAWRSRSSFHKMSTFMLRV